MTDETNRSYKHQIIIDEMIKEVIIAVKNNPNMSLIEIIYFLDSTRTREWKIQNSDILRNVRRFNQLRAKK